MSLNRIQEELSKIGRITARWNDAPVSDIERQLVLDKLKSLYEQVLFFGQEFPGEAVTDAVKNDVVAGPSAEELGVQAEEMLREFDRELAESTPAEPIADVKEDASAEISVEAPSDSSAEKSAPAVSEEPEKPAAAGMGTDQPLFDMDEIVVRRRLDHRTILSLYGENCKVIKNESGRTEVRCERFVEETHLEEPYSRSDEELSEEAETPVEATAPVAEPIPAAEPVQDEIRNQDTEFEDEPEESNHSFVVGKSGAVLGEVIAHGETLGDALARNATHDDLASRVAATRTDGLRGSIGINDKFLLIRDLFGGDSQAYEEAVSALEQFTDLDEAMLYLHDHYAWNPDSEGVKLLVELLVRKLS